MSATLSQTNNGFIKIDLIVERFRYKVSNIYFNIVIYFESLTVAILNVNYLTSLCQSVFFFIPNLQLFGPTDTLGVVVLIRRFTPTDLIIFAGIQCN